MRDIRWLGFDWGKYEYMLDYYQQLYEIAVRLIEEAKPLSTT
jgi:glutaminyl-tRNA synthetase